MSDPRAALRLFDELLWVVRRAGIPIATAQVIDAMRAVACVGVESPSLLEDALAAVVVKRREDRERFERAFREFFSGEPRQTLWDRLRSKDVSDSEIALLAELFERLAVGTSSQGSGALGPLVHRGAELDRLLQLAGCNKIIENVQNSLQVGFFTHRVLEQAGVWKSHEELRLVRTLLSDALGAERGASIAAFLAAEVQRSVDEIRTFVKSTAQRRGLHDRSATAPISTLDVPFASLEDEGDQNAAERKQVQAAVRALVQKLQGSARVRKRRAKASGRLDVRAMQRRAMRTGGVAFERIHRIRRRDKSQLVMVCDVSDSVRTVARFLLELAYTAQELFERTRTFVFVSELGETTELFDEHPIERAIALAYSGAVVPVTSNSNYGRMFRLFQERVLDSLDRRTTVVFVGDGRTNYQDDGADILDAIKTRSRAVVWLCPEPRSAWATGDSAMRRYAANCTRTLEVRCVRDLEVAVRTLVALR